MMRAIANFIVALFQIAFVAVIAVVWWDICIRWPTSKMLLIGVPGLSIALAMIGGAGIVLNIGRAKGMLAASLTSLAISVASAVAAFVIGG